MWLFRAAPKTRAVKSGSLRPLPLAINYENTILKHTPNKCLMLVVPCFISILQYADSPGFGQRRQKHVSIWYD